MWAKAEFRVPFDLTTGPLMRATLLRLDEQEHLLVALCITLSMTAGRRMSLAATFRVL